MEDGKRTAGLHKQEKKYSNYFSQFWLCWMLPVLYIGNKRDIEEFDLIPPPSKKFSSDALGEKLERYWLAEMESSQRKNRKPKLWRAVRNAFWLSFMPGAFLVLTGAIAKTIQPLIFTRLLSYWSADSEMTKTETGYYALGLLLLFFVSMLCYHHNNLFVGKFGMKIRVATCSLLYRKLLRMSQGSLQDVAAGKLVNLMSNDVSRFDTAFVFMHYLWLTPLQATVVIYLMYNSAGMAPIVGIFTVLLLILPLQASLTKLTAVLRRKTAPRTDKRIKLMSEIINGIQVIKMYAWEIPFQKVVKEVRAYEMNSLKMACFVQGTFGSFVMFTERSTLFLTMLTLVLTGNMATATTIYPIQQYFSIIQTNVALVLPMAIANFTEMLVSLERIQEFLLLEERDDLATMPSSLASKTNGVKFRNKVISYEPKYILPKSYKKSNLGGLSTDLVHKPHRPLNDVAIELNGVSASWTKTNKRDQMTLKNISFKIGRGKLFAIIGPVGSGKSSLLQVLLKELQITKGSVQINGKISYACQNSWLFPDTVRENILFGLPYDSKKYKEVCRVCCLLPDFKQFPYGDLSLVGERGVTLSGGQRARVNLARAVYRDADIIILDDPLSAVDANVGRQLFEGCIKGYLQERTCILVTHQIHFLKAADYIAILNEGSIDGMGSYDDLVKSKKEFSVLLSNLQDNSDVCDKVGSIKVDIRPQINRGTSSASTKSDSKPETQKEQVLAKEERAKGHLKWSVLRKYLSAVNSWCLVIVALFTLVFTQALCSLTDYWISFWTNQVNDYIQSLPEGEEPDPGLWVQIGVLTTGQFAYIHGALVFSIVTFSFIRLIGYVSMTMRASANMHNLMFQNLIKAVMRFFDTNPSGRVINRFSKDMGAMDEQLPRSALQIMQTVMSMTSVLILNAVSLPWTLIPTFTVIFIFFFVLKWYLNAAQSVKRLEGTTKSPIFSMINSTLSGMTTIRTSNAQIRLIKSFDDCQDLHSSACYTYIGGFAAFGLYLDLFCLCYIGSIIAIFILIDFDNLMPVGSVGLAVSQSMMLMILLQLAAKFTADFLGQLTAVERVLEYTSLPHEENINEGLTHTPEQWPSEGKISFQNVFLSYSTEDPPVLKNVNFEIQSGWKVGVVGRTGAGKSSLISALFRLYDTSGSIKIDGIDTTGISKQHLRSKISIIPQEPVLFSATLRYNLDPFNHYTDDEIWKALEQVELKEAIPALDFKISEGGANFSVGQRQLICLARAVLRSNKILVMDEATANVDPQTDGLIQKTIRRTFASCTVVTIAHRLNTIMDSDRVLVMDKGTVAEFDYPYKLLSRPNSLLSLMVKETGEHMGNVLREMAENKYNTEHSQN